jgi:hypothetical protein
MMKNYLFETCRGEFNWNKLMRKSVHLFGCYHVDYLMSYVITLNVTVCRCMVPGSNSILSTKTLKSLMLYKEPTRRNFGSIVY